MDRGGIDGAPIGLDWIDARHSEFLGQVKRRIQERWGYPCVQGSATHTCEYLNAHLVVEVGILKSGQLQYVEVVRSSGYALYDDYAVRAIRAASPYPPVPLELVKEGSAGLPIRTAFNYVTQPRLIGPAPIVQRLPAQSSRSIASSVMLGARVAALVVAGALCARMLRRRRSAAPDPVSAGASVRARSEGRPAASPSVSAHEALLAHGWHDEGDTAVHGLTTLRVRSYTHPGLDGHRVNVAPTGAWEHTKIPGMPARGSTPEELAQHLGAIHGTLSIADLHLPGRRFP